jgi:hypothetical protein
VPFVPIVSGDRDGKKVSEEEAKDTVIRISGSNFVFPDVSKIGSSANGNRQTRSEQEPQIDRLVNLDRWIQVSGNLRIRRPWIPGLLC